MDIPALSTGLSQMKIGQEVSVALMKKTMDQAEGQVNDLSKLLEVNSQIMEQSVQHNIGSNIDIKL
ncbi:putative motility protein YjfB-like [Natranaerovirga hydrolytica]|uniref:Putative motility protein YjfB-like n=1 Tax=Natranaerovirga hydrolytica TaxID=680378 RepID=A0A4R1MKV8_9FIRM|nr:YjfB family protein [Natranaerovirga hydrolytica]TCK93386.1 putative motility protein YjfB-like [Natranaerovirga hydrolytica]